MINNVITKTICHQNATCVPVISKSAMIRQPSAMPELLSSDTASLLERVAVSQRPGMVMTV